MKRYTPQHAIKRKRITTGRIIGFCICLMAAAITLAVGITLAKMVSTAGGSNYAQVAAFIVEAEATDGETLIIDCIGTKPYTADYSFTVTNTKAGKTAEVSMQYDVIVTLPEALPEGITMELDNGSIPPIINGNIYTYSHAGTFSVGNLETHTHTLMFSTDSNEDIRLRKFIVSVHAEQID